MGKAKQVTVIFTQDFANKEEGEHFRCDGMLASQLVRVDKVAKYEAEPAEVQPEPQPEKVEHKPVSKFGTKEKVAQKHTPKKKK